MTPAENVADETLPAPLDPPPEEFDDEADTLEPDDHEAGEEDQDQ